MLYPTKKGEIGIKEVFGTFFVWFLRKKYQRIMQVEGRMDNRQAYIDWKNKIVHFAQLQERNYDRIF
jgi:hypothetical protein